MAPWNLLNFANRMIPHSAPDAVPRLRASFQILSSLSDTLPAVSLQQGEIAILGGQTFRQAPTLVFHVSFGMRWNPDLFPDVRFAAVDLDQVQAEADAWGDVAGQLRSLTRTAEENQIRAQAQAVGMARMVMDQVKGGIEHPNLAPHLDHDARSRAMSPAFALNAELHDRKRKKAADNRAEKNAAAAATSAAAPVVPLPAGSAPAAAPAASPAPAAAAAASPAPATGHMSTAMQALITGRWPAAPMHESTLYVPTAPLPTPAPATNFHAPTPAAPTPATSARRRQRGPRVTLASTSHHRHLAALAGTLMRDGYPTASVDPASAAAADPARSAGPAG